MITINVTQEDIDNGIRCSECECPVAIAIRKRCYSLYTDVYIGVRQSDILIKDDSDHFYIELDMDEDVRSWIAIFDEQGADRVKPFSFNLNVPPEDFLPDEV